MLANNTATFAGQKYVSVLFDRELCSKVLKEALLLLFFLAWGKHEQNMFHMEQKMFATENAPNGTKNVPWRTKKCSYGQSIIFCGTLNCCLALYDIAMVLCGLAWWFSVVFCGLVWSCVAMS